ncbi:unnamed protein product [Rodentolepis nana]|uniref:Secreted protein n=1 Tax=Rodentolepis nana TaxID=102285 RepID=A0A0R3T4X7_RODNA|nr:unnamed protein product [Rodentolepis nana]
MPLSKSSLPTTVTPVTTTESGEEYADERDFNIFVIAFSALQEEVTHDCRRIATLLLSGFLVVGILPLNSE